MSYTRVAEDAEQGLLNDDSQDTRVPIKLLGYDVARRTAHYQYVLTFPVERPGDREAQEAFAKPVEDPTKIWKAVFHTHKAEDIPSFDSGITKKDFTSKVVSKIWDILEGNGYEVDHFESIDQDELFVAFRARSIEPMADLAEARVRIRPSAYHAAFPDSVERAVPCETVDAKGAFVKQIVDTGLDGRPITSECPHYVRLSTDILDKVEPMPEPEQLRVIRKHLRSLFRIVELEKYGISAKFFPPHEWSKLEALHARGWNNPKALLQWPHESTSDFIHQYMGPSIAFFFHFYGLFARWMILPAALSLGLFTYWQVQGAEVEKVRWANSIFGALLCLWATVFLARYEQLVNLKKVRWGMSDAVKEAGFVLRTFSDPYRGTVAEALQNLAHWLLCGLVLAQFVWAIFKVVDLRNYASTHEDETTLGIPNSYVLIAVKYFITLNIKVVDFGWTAVSTWLSKKENHRTDSDLKSAMAVKIFAVKFVIFYYPFARTLLVQPHLKEGCPGDDPVQGCVDMLKEDLQVFFVTQVATELIMTLVTLAMLKWTIHKEIQRRRGDSDTQKQSITYIEVQAMTDAYDETLEITDYMTVVTNFGFITMFGVISPFICVLCFLANFPMKRLLAFKFSYALQRVVPSIQDGIGSWASIIQFVAFVGISFTVYVVLFVYNVYHADLAAKLMGFLVLERVFILIRLAGEGFFGSKTVSQLRIEEYNDEVIDRVLPRAAKVQFDTTAATSSTRPARLKKM